MLDSRLARARPGSIRSRSRCRGRGPAAIRVAAQPFRGPAAPPFRAASPLVPSTSRSRRPRARRLRSSPARTTAGRAQRRVRARPRCINQPIDASGETAIPNSGDSAIASWSTDPSGSQRAARRRSGPGSRRPKRPAGARATPTASCSSSSPSDRPASSIHSDERPLVEIEESEQRVVKVIVAVVEDDLPG